MSSYSHLIPNDPQVSPQTPGRQSQRYARVGSLFITLWCALVVGLALVGSVRGVAQATDIGFDPSRFRVVYTVPDGPVPGTPIYKVEPLSADLHFNTDQTPFLLPCDVDRFGIDVWAGSAAGGDSVYWAVTISFFQLDKNGIEHPIGSHGCYNNTPTFYSGTSCVTDPLVPGTEAEAGFTPIDSADQPYCAFQFQATDFKKNAPVRMHVELTPYSNSGCTGLVTDTNPSNNGFDFWLKLAKSESVCP